MKKVLVTILVILSILVTYLISTLKENAKQEHLSKSTKIYTKAYKEIYNEKKHISDILFYGLIKRGKIKERLAKLSEASEKEKDIIRYEMYKSLKQRYNELKIIGLKQLHVHLADNTSFLRMHKPDKYGDDLTLVRPTVAYVNKENKPIDGMEEGRVSYGMRSVYPLNDKNVHLGSIEISFGASSITSSMMKSYYVLSNFFINRDVVDRKVFEDVKNSAYIPSHHKGFYYDKEVLAELKKVSRKDMKSLKPKKSMADKLRKAGLRDTPSSLYDESIDAIFTIIPIINPLTKENIAFLTVRSKDEFIAISDKQHNIILFGTLSFLIVTFYLIYVSFRTKENLNREVRKKTKELQKLNESLEDKIQERIQEQNILLSLFDISNINLFKWKNNENWSIEYVSSSVQSVFGYTKEDFLNSTVKYADIIFEEDKQRVIDEVVNAIENDMNYFIHELYRVVKKDNSIVWVHDTTMLLKNDNGEIEYFLGYIQDVTKETENNYNLIDANERFELLMEVSKDGLWDWNPITNKVYFSKRWKSMLGYEESSIKDDLAEWSSRVHPDDIEQAFEDVTTHLAGKTDFYENIHRMKHKDGHWVWILDSGKALFRKDGKAYRVIGFHRDITLQKEYEGNLEKLVNEKTFENLEQLKMIEHQSKMASMGEMIGAIAHQWRQPLNAISINIQNLEYDYEDGLINKEFLDAFVEKNKKTINFMSKTIDNFRNFFRIDKQKELFCTKDAIEDIVNMQDAQLKSHSIEVVVQGDGFKVDGFKTEFMQVVLNLINNAKDEIIEKNIEYKKIVITLCKKKKLIVVKDKAGGVRKDVIDRIFEPYFTTKAQGKGTGMGLYMSKMIIEKNMAGALSVKNTKEGAMFSIEFEPKIAGGGGRYFK